MQAAELHIRAAAAVGEMVVVGATLQAAGQAAGLAARRLAKDARTCAGCYKNTMREGCSYCVMFMPGWP